jgi:hypothetical protein
MAKEIKEQQIDLFYEPPKVAGLGITKFEISGAGVKATVEGVTNTNDIALLDNPCWQKAVAAWALSLHGGDVDEAIISMKKAYVDHINSTGESHRPTVETYEDALTELALRSLDQLERQEAQALEKAGTELSGVNTPPLKSNGKGKSSAGTTLSN